MISLTFLAVVSAIAGTASALLSGLDQWEKHPQRRRLLHNGAGVCVVLSAVLFLLSPPEPSKEQEGAVPAEPRLKPPGTVLPPGEGGSGAAQPPRPEPRPQELDGAVAPQQPEPDAPYAHWLRSDGMTILYDASRYIEGGCQEGTMAVGDFSPRGWGGGPIVRCLSDGWLAFDASILLHDPRVFVGNTYCLNFVTPDGAWGQHGGAQRAPGMDRIGVPAAEGPAAGINIGFRLIRSGDTHQIEFTREGVAHCQSG